MEGLKQSDINCVLVSRCTYVPRWVSLACHHEMGWGLYVWFMKSFPGHVPGSCIFHRHTTEVQTGMVRALVTHYFLEKAGR